MAFKDSAVRWESVEVDGHQVYEYKSGDPRYEVGYAYQDFQKSGGVPDAERVANPQDERAWDEVLSRLKAQEGKHDAILLALHELKGRVDGLDKQPSPADGFSPQGPRPEQQVRDENLLATDIPGDYWRSPGDLNGMVE